MRILHLTDRFTDRGGAHRHLRSIVRAQAEAGHEVHLAAGAGDASDEPLGAATHPLDGLDSRLAVDVGLGPLLRRVRPEVVHVHTVVNPLALARAAAAGAVFTVQDHRTFCPARGKWTAGGEPCRTALSAAACAECFDERAYEAEMMALTQARLDAIRGSVVVVLSEYMKRELVQVGLAPGRVHVVPPFVDFPIGPGGDMPEGPACVLFLGRLVAAKGPLDAVSAWRASGVDLPLLAAGTGPLRADMESAGATVLGWVSHDRLPALLRRARAVLMPSRWQEPFGLAGLEALSLGVPVVAWDSGAIREWHPGPLPAWGDVPALGRALAAAVHTRPRVPTGFERGPLMRRLEEAYAGVS